jgi:hypothetical protein
LFDIDAALRYVFNLDPGYPVLAFFSGRPGRRLTRCEAESNPMLDRPA